MDQYQKNISFSEREIESCKQALLQWIEKKDADWIMSLMCDICEEYLTMALFRWRQGDDPRPDLHSGLDWADKALAAIVEWQATPEAVARIEWPFFQTMAYIADRPFELGFDLLPADTPHMEVDRAFAAALHNRSYTEALAAPLAKICGQKRLARECNTYRTYFAIIEAGTAGSDVTGLIHEAEALYKSRARTTAGAGFQGYDLYNKDVVDWQIAALIKKTNWTGESIHRWRWG
jgi:hypothetical protein